MPVTPITIQSKWRSEKLPDGRVILINPIGDDVAQIYGGKLQDRLDRACLIVAKLNK